MYTEATTPHTRHGPEVDADRVRAIAEALRDQVRSGAEVMPETWSDPAYWNVEDRPSQRCQFLAVGNAMNFRFWTVVAGELKPSVGVLEGETYRGSMYLWRRLRLAVRRGEFSLKASFFADITEEQFQTAFSDDDGTFPLAPAASDRVVNLRDLGRRLRDDWEGEFSNVVRAAEGSLERFADLCKTFRAYNDPVRKLTMVNAIMLTGSGLAQFDTEPLPGVDYHLMKQALRQGLVIPPNDVATKLTTGEFLDSDESLALRTAVLRALVEVAVQAGISTALLDNLYWMNRRVCSGVPLCEQCPFQSACPQRTNYSLPLELTRYY